MEHYQTSVWYCYKLNIMKKIVAYYRSSTKEQQYSIEVQRTQMHEYVTKNGHDLIAEYWEHHSGKINTRIQLEHAINHCIKENCTLGFTKLDRLSRKISFLYKIKESSLDLVCLDMPELNTLTFGIFSVMAQYEAELISARTSRTLQEIRKTKKLGNPLGWSANLETAIETKNRKRNEWLLSDDIKKAVSLINLLSTNGKKMTLREISRNLNYHSIPTQRGKKWNPIQVKRLLIHINHDL